MLAANMSNSTITPCSGPKLKLYVQLQIKEQHMTDEKLIINFDSRANDFTCSTSDDYQNDQTHYTVKAEANSNYP